MVHLGFVSVSTVAAFAGAYVFSMIFLSPDLDLSRSRAARRWGILRWLWLPYAGMFRHRRISHHLLLGPLTRVLYLVAVVLAIVSLAALATKRAIQVGRPSLSLLCAVFAGLYLPNVTHIVADRAYSAWRKRRASRRL